MVGSHGDVQVLRRKTERLLLVAATVESVRAELQGLDRFSRLLNVTVPPGWPPGEYDRHAQEFFLEHLEKQGSSAVGWYGWYAILRTPAEDDAVLVGCGGFLGPPNNDGEVEIGYSIDPSWQGKGYAAELVKGLTEIAFADNRVQSIIAHTKRENVASCKVLDRCGFEWMGDGTEPGMVRYELLRAPRSA